MRRKMSKISDCMQLEIEFASGLLENEQNLRIQSKILLRRVVKTFAQKIIFIAKQILYGILASVLYR